MHSALNIAALIFVPIGLIVVLISTSFFSDWSETALVNSFYGVVLAAGGILGGYLGRANIVRALLLGILCAILGVVALNIFFSTIWRML